MSTLLDRVRGLALAVASAVPPDDAATARSALERLDQPLRVAIAGRVKAGKSTLLNAIVGEPVAAVDTAECTRVVTWYGEGDTYRAWRLDADGARHQVPFRRSDRRASIDLTAEELPHIDHLEVEIPSSRLRSLTLIDTPGITSISERVSARTTEFLTPVRGDEGADVVVYLLRHLHVDDSDFLEAFSGRSAERDDAVRCVGVLSRADELGCGRGDSLELARRLSRSHGGLPSLRRYVDHVIPVSGLLAVAGTTLTEAEFATLAAVAGGPLADLERLTLSADRFTAPSRVATVDHEARTLAFDRLGLFGVRLCTTLIRNGLASDATALATELERLSGIASLRSILLDRFAARADTLKAARALDAMRAVLDRCGRDAPAHLSTMLDQISANAHELEELRCLSILHHDDVPIDEAGMHAVRLALGATGTTPAQRVGVEATIEREDLATALRDRIVELRRLAAQPFRPRSVDRVVSGAVRSLEQAHHDLGSDAATPQQVDHRL
jgi:hypothetical protein